MFCTGCGKERTNIAAVFCENCGKSFREPQPLPTQPKNPQVKTKDDDKSTYTNLIIILVQIVLLWLFSMAGCIAIDL